MQVHINTDDHIRGYEQLAAHVETVVEQALDHLSGRITRVEVHLSDENSRKGGDDDKRCVMEARVEGYGPVAVTDRAPTFDQAIDGAAEKLKKSLEHSLGRLRER